MKYLLALMLLLVPFHAFVSISISPNYARMPVNSNQTFTIQLEGDGKTYGLELYAPYMDWQTKNVWVGSSKKTFYATFSPLGDGEYTITANLKDLKDDYVIASDEATVNVYIPKSNDLWDRIQAMKKTTKDPKILAQLNDVEALYNESRFELAEIKLNDINLNTPSTSFSSLPKFALAGIIALVSIVAVKLLLG